MKLSLLVGWGLLWLLCLTAVARAQTTQAVYAPFLGRWKGELTYRDYSNDKRVTLPTTLDVTLTPDAKALRQHYVFDDGPGKSVEETETVTVSVEKNTYAVQDSDSKSPRLYAVSGLQAWAQKKGGVLVLSGEGEDNGKKSDVRNTIMQNGNALTILHETRLPGEVFRFRNQYRFTRTEIAPAVTRLTAKQLQADYVILEKAYKELHPGLYRYNTPPQMDAHFQTLKARLNHDQSVSEAYVAIAQFLATVRCGHSYPNFYNQPSPVLREVITSAPRLPFYFRWVGDKMIVTRGFTSGARLAPGTEVVALNGVSVGEIQRRLVAVSRADGANDAKRVSNMEVRGGDKYEAFDVYWPLLFPFKGDTLTLKIKPSATKEVATLTVPLMTHEQRLAIQRQDAATHQAVGDAPDWDFHFLAPDAKTAYLHMTTWGLYNSKWDWKEFLDNAFAQMVSRKTENLVLDLRGNEGGISIGNYVVGKLIARDLPLESLQRWVRYRKVPDDLSPYLDTWDMSFKDWGKDIREADTTNGYYRMTRFDDGPDGDVIKADSRSPFRGRTFVIVDASNSSATFEFAQIMQQNRLGTLVGQPTGGNQRGINGGAFFFLRLPNSKIEVDVPLIGAFPPSVRPALDTLTKCPIPDTGLTPNILVTPRIEDIANGIDTELAAVLKAIATNAARR